MKAIILAAGKGNRLMPLTAETPKPLLIINNIRIIDRIFMSLPDEIDEVIIVVDYLKDKIINAVGDNFYGRTVQYINQIPIRGTFGALLSTQKLIGKDERFLVLNGDDINNKTELSAYLKYPRTFGVQKMLMPGYHSIRIDAENKIEGFNPQLEFEKLNGALVATGVYIVDSHIFEHPGVLLKDGEYGLPQTLLDQKNTYPLTAIQTKKWLPINSLEDLEKAKKILI